MAQSSLNPQPEQPTYLAASAAPQTSTVPMPQAAPGADGKKTGAGGKLGRRALLAGAGVAACAAGVALVPVAENSLQNYAQQQANNALQAGIAQGEQAVLNDLANLEGIAIDDAIQVAELTRLGVKYILLPVATVIATLEGDAIQLLIDGVNSAVTNLAKINIHISQLTTLQSILNAWHTNITQLPITLKAYANADITSAETYLKALKKRIDQGVK
ncbi:MAG: hypothetical protein ABI068_04895 [Ktedonobacterales bacterium]